MARMQPSPSVAKQYERYKELDAKARKLWDARDRELKKLVRAAKMGRKVATTIPISESRGVEITNQWREAMREGKPKVFVPAFSHQYKVEEVALTSA